MASSKNCGVTRRMRLGSKAAGGSACTWCKVKMAPTPRVSGATSRSAPEKWSALKSPFSSVVERRLICTVLRQRRDQLASGRRRRHCDGVPAASRRCVANEMQLRRIEAKEATVVLEAFLAAGHDTGVDVALDGGDQLADRLVGPGDHDVIVGFGECIEEHVDPIFVF